MKKLEELNQEELIELVKAYDKYLLSKDTEVLICISEFYYNNMVKRYDGKLRCKSCGELLTKVGIYTQKYISYKVGEDGNCIPFLEEEGLLNGDICCSGCCDAIEDDDTFKRLNLQKINFGSDE